MLTFKANIVLHENQRVIDRHPARFKVIKAGKRFGKTKWAVYVCFREAMQRRNAMIWYVAPTYGQAKDIAWRDLLSICPPGTIVRKSENELTIKFVTGCEIVLKGAENENSLRGIKIDVLVMDETAYIKQYVWPTILAGQLLAGGVNPIAIFISSPNRTGKNWFTAFYDEKKMLMESGNKDWATFYFTIHDNPTLSKEVIKEIESSCTEDMFKTEYLAIESDATGPLVPEFRYEKHTYDVEVLPENTLNTRALDWGISHPTTCLWGHFDRATPRVWISKEFYKTDFLIYQSAEVILKMTGNSPIDWSVIDPSTAKRNSQTPRSDKDEFARYGVHCFAGDNRDRGYHIMRMFFKKDLIKIHKSCRNLISELRNYQIGDKEGDDCLDPLRYKLVMAHDSLYGGKVFGVEENFKRPEHGYSLFDTALFPKEEPEYSYQGL